MRVTASNLTEGRLRERLGGEPPRDDAGAYRLAGANLARLSLTQGQLAGADLQGACLRGCDLQRAVLTGADLRGADLSEAKLPRVDLRGADLRGADLRRAVLVAAMVDGCRLAGARLEAAVVREVPLWRTDLLPAVSAALAELSFAGALRAETPTGQRGSATGFLAWCVACGGRDEREVVAALLSNRRWRAHREELNAALRAMDARLGPLTSASLSRAAPAPPDAGLSRTEPPSQP